MKDFLFSEFGLVIDLNLSIHFIFGENIWVPEI